MKLRYRIVFEGEYDADPLHYETDSVLEAAEIDRRNAHEDVFLFLDSVTSPRVTIEIDAVDKDNDKARST